MANDTNGVDIFSRVSNSVGKWGERKAVVSVLIFLLIVSSSLNVWLVKIYIENTRRMHEETTRLLEKILSESKQTKEKADAIFGK